VIRFVEVSLGIGASLAVALVWEKIGDRIKASRLSS